MGLSVALAWVILRVEKQLEGRTEEIFEGTAMLLAVIVLTWMIYWMRYQAKRIKSSLEQDVQSAIDAGERRGLILVSFVAVFREGVETALFLTAAALSTERSEVWIGAILGLALAFGLGLILYTFTIHLELRWFFRLTSILLVIFAAGLLAHGIHEFQEASLLPASYPNVWDINHILDESSGVGEILASLVGYNGNPSLLEVVAYFGYWGFILFGVRWIVKRKLP